MRRILALLYVSFLSGCAGSQPMAAASAETPAPAPVSAEALHGFWAQYWAREGEAETQRYVFLADGRFGWLAPQRDVPPQDPRQRSGTYAVEGDVLVLSVLRERFAGCSSGCPHAEPRIVEHAEPMRITLDLGECPPNEEAAQIDTAYKCLSVGGHAFWRRGAPETQASGPYFE